jgi:AraC family cel operon transcriptional repressor
MKKIQLLSREYIDQEVGGSCGFFRSLIYASAEHYHDFFEFFLITEGRVNHIVNNNKQVLNKGAFVFIRPDDVHFYKKINNDDCQFFNLAFRAELAYDLFRFLGPAYEPERLLQAEMPPYVRISAEKLESTKAHMEAFLIQSGKDKHILNLQLKKTLLDFFTSAFPIEQYETSLDLPDWLHDLCTKMKIPENFRGGLDSLQGLACRSHEHLCHVFQKYLQTTPTAYINELRLEYAVNLLLFTDKPIVEVILDSGFNNLSHFYHLFKNKFSIPPKQYRKLYGKFLVPMSTGLLSESGKPIIAVDQGTAQSP